MHRDRGARRAATARATTGPGRSSASRAGEHDRERERGEAAAERDPRRDRGAARGVRAEVAGKVVLEHDPGGERSGQHEQRRKRVSNGAPPTNANANGTNPAARRDCESETRSEKCGKTSHQSSGTSTSAIRRARTRSSAAAGERGERHEHEGRDSDRPRPRDHARREVVAVCEGSIRSLA